MTNSNKISQFMLKAVKQRQRLIKAGKSRLSSSDLRHTLIYLKAYAEEIKDRKRMARFYINHYTQVLDVAPPTWSKKAEELYNECQLIINS